MTFYFTLFAVLMYNIQNFVLFIAALCRNICNKEEASTHKDAKSQSGAVFVPCDLDL